MSLLKVYFVVMTNLVIWLERLDKCILKTKQNNNNKKKTAYCPQWITSGAGSACSHTQLIRHC